MTFKSRELFIRSNPLPTICEFDINEYAVSIVCKKQTLIQSLEWERKMQIKKLESLVEVMVDENFILIL